MSPGGSSTGTCMAKKHCVRLVCSQVSAWGSHRCHSQIAHTGLVVAGRQAIPHSGPAPRPQVHATPASRLTTTQWSTTATMLARCQLIVFMQPRHRRHHAAALVQHRQHRVHQLLDPPGAAVRATAGSQVSGLGAAAGISKAFPARFCGWRHANARRCSGDTHARSAPPAECRHVPCSR
jgi:hypothetical protein